MNTNNITKLLGTAMIAYAVASAGVNLAVAETAHHKNIQVAKVHHYTGEISSISGDKLMLKDGKGGSRTFTVEKTSMLEGLKTGDGVIVTLSNGQIESIQKKDQNKQAS